MTITKAPVQYKGDDLDPERGPGLGCFRFQLIVLGIFIVLTPLTVAWQWPEWISTVLLFAVVILLLVTGQTIIFLLRLVAADRRSRRRPLGSATRTVGELEDEAELDRPDGAQFERPEGADLDRPDEPVEPGPATPPSGDPGLDPGLDEMPPSNEGPVRQ